MNKLKMVITMPDGTKWEVPILKIAENRAGYYKKEFDNDIQLSLEKDTLPLFEEDDYEIIDWAQNNMNWSDVEQFAAKLWQEEVKVDYQEGWRNGEKKII